MRPFLQDFGERDTTAFTHVVQKSNRTSQNYMIVDWMQLKSRQSAGGSSMRGKSKAMMYHPAGDQSSAFGKLGCAPGNEGYLYLHCFLAFSLSILSSPSTTTLPKDPVPTPASCTFQSAEFPPLTLFARRPTRLASPLVTGTI